MRTQDRIIDRIQKLLRLSKSATDAEAALAATRAAELMAAHNLTEATVRAADDSGGAKAEPIVKGVRVEDPESRAAKKKVAWKGTISRGVAHSMGCQQYWSGPSIMFFGRQSAVQAASYTAQYLWREVDRLADAAFEEGLGLDEGGGCETPRQWKTAFRLGAAGKIAERLHEQARNAATARKAAAQAAATPTSGSQALVIVNKDADEVEQEFEKFTKGFVNVRLGGGRIRSWGGFGAGQRAGASVHLGGGRAALGRGPGRLPKGGR